MKKISIGIIVIFGFLVLAGCGNNPAQIEAPKAKVQQKKETTNTSEKLPEATGNVDDAVEAAEEIAKGEDAIVSEEENEARASVSEEDINDLSNSYEENEL